MSHQTHRNLRRNTDPVESFGKDGLRLARLYHLQNNRIVGEWSLAATIGHFTNNRVVSEIACLHQL